MTGAAACCARAANGHATAALPTSVTKSRRFIVAPMREAGKLNTNLPHRTTAGCDVNHAPNRPRSDGRSGTSSARCFPMPTRTKRATTRHRANGLVGRLARLHLSNPHELFNVLVGVEQKADRDFSRVPWRPSRSRRRANLLAPALGGCRIWSHERYGRRRLPPACTGSRCPPRRT